MTIRKQVVGQSAERRLQLALDRVDRGGQYAEDDLLDTLREELRIDRRLFVGTPIRALLRDVDRGGADMDALLDAVRQQLAVPAGARGQRAYGHRGAYTSGYLSPRVEAAVRSAVAYGATTRREVLTVLRHKLGRDYHPGAVVDRSVDYWLAHRGNAPRARGMGIGALASAAGHLQSLRGPLGLTLTSPW